SSDSSRSATTRFTSSSRRASSPSSGSSIARATRRSLGSGREALRPFPSLTTTLKWRRSRRGRSSRAPTVRPMESPMKAARVHRFGPPSVIAMDELPRSEAGPGELLVRVGAAGVGHWDALVREGKVPQSLPLILGSELSGTVEAIGSGVSGFEIGDEVYGATHELFSGACAEYARPSAGRMSPKPRGLNLVEAAAVPIVSVTAWQMLFEYAAATAGQTVLVHGGA